MLYSAQHGRNFVLFDITDLTPALDMIKLMAHLEESVRGNVENVGLSFSCASAQGSTLTGVIVIFNEVVNRWGKKLFLIEKDVVKQEKIRNICEILGVTIYNSQSLLKLIQPVAA